MIHDAFPQLYIVLLTCKSDITLSTVAVGDSSDTSLLRRLADNCGGRYYYSDESGDIPRIFAQEVFLGGDSYIQNGVSSTLTASCSAGLIVVPPPSLICLIPCLIAALSSASRGQFCAGRL